jgi:hypothetical protein
MPVNIGYPNTEREKIHAEAVSKECFRRAALLNLADAANATASATGFKDQSGINQVQTAMNIAKPEWAKLCSEADTKGAAERKNRFERLVKDEGLHASFQSAEKAATRKRARQDDGSSQERPLQRW